MEWFLKCAALLFPYQVISPKAGGTRKEYIHFLIVAYGSCCEIETQSILSQRLGFISEKDFSEIQTRVASIGRMLRGLQKSLKTEAPESLSPLAA